jgi:hypothetical protein
LAGHERHFHPADFVVSTIGIYPESQVQLLLIELTDAWRGHEHLLTSLIAIGGIPFKVVALSANVYALLGHAYVVSLTTFPGQ